MALSAIPVSGPATTRAYKEDWAERFRAIDRAVAGLRGGAATETTELRTRDFIQLTSNEELMYELSPSVVGRFKGAPVAINADGFRGPRIPLRRSDPNTLRIVGPSCSRWPSS